MKTRAINLFKNGLIAAAVGTATLLSAGSANAQYSFGGSTMQPRQPTWQEQQRRQQMQQRPVPQYYYQPAPPARPPQTRYMPHPTGIPGMAPVPFQLSPQAASGISNFAVKQVPKCVKGGIAGAGVGFYKGGPPGAARGAGVGCVTNVISN